MAFGNFSSAEMPTDYGQFRLHVLPELVELGFKNGKPVATFLEHYALVPHGFRPFEQAIFYIHRTNLFEDLFRPACEDTLNIPQQISQLLNLTGNGILLYVDELKPASLDELRKNVDVAHDCKVASTSAIIEKFSKHPEIGVQAAPLLTRIDQTDSPQRIQHLDVHRLDEIVNVSFPPAVRKLLFPDVGPETIFLKQLSHFALVNNTNRPADPKEYPYVRVHSSCGPGDLNSAQTCDCGIQFRIAVRRVVNRGGAIVYDHAEARGAHTLAGKMGFYGTRLETYDAMAAFGYPRDAEDGRGVDMRTYTGPARLLSSLGMTSVILGTNNEKKQKRLTAQGITIINTERVLADKENMPEARRRYLETKRREGGHKVGACL